MLKRILLPVIPLPGVDKLLKQFGGLLQQSDLAPEVQAQLRQKLQTLLADMDLVTREEFDAQTAVLQRTRQQLEELEKTLEKLMAEQVDSPSSTEKDGD